MELNKPNKSMQALHQKQHSKFEPIGLSKWSLSRCIQLLESHPTLDGVALKFVPITLLICVVQKYKREGIPAQ